MVNLGKPPLPPNKPYCRPLNYLEYVKILTQMFMLEYLIKANSETDDAKNVHLFNFTFRDIVSDWCNNYMGDYPYYTFAKLELAFCKR